MSAEVQAIVIGLVIAVVGIVAVGVWRSVTPRRWRS